MSDILDALGWLLDRSQQGLFQGSKAYAENTARNQQYLSKDLGVPEPFAGFIGGTASIYPAMVGATQGMTGLGRRVDGTELSQDFTGNVEVDRAIGNQLNMTADIPTPIMALKKLGAAGKTINDLAGQAKRTWGSIRGANKIQPENVAKLDERLGNWWYKYGLDVPVSPKMANEPLAIRSDRPGALANRMGYTSSGLPINEDATRGFSLPDVNAIAYKPASQYTTLPHELRHWARKVIPEELMPVANTVYDWIHDTYPLTVAALRRIPSYAKKSNRGIADEIFARNGPDIIEDWGNVGNILQRLEDTAQKTIQPEMYQAARPWGVSNIPMGLNVTRELWDDYGQ